MLNLYLHDVLKLIFVDKSDFDRRFLSVSYHFFMLLVTNLGCFEFLYVFILSATDAIEVNLSSDFRDFELLFRFEFLILVFFAV